MSQSSSVLLNFWMTRNCYTLLCNTIIARVGERLFKSESYIDAFLRKKDPIYVANCHITCGYIYGEVRVGITLHFLLGLSVLDLGVMFDINSNYCHQIFYKVLLD